MTRKLVLVLVILAAMIVALAQLFLAYGLTDSMRKWVLPAFKSKYRAEVDVDRVGVNLLGGTLHVRGVKVANPPGFKEPLMLSVEKCVLKVGLPALLRSGSADIRKATFRNASLTIVRDANGALNMDNILEAVRADHASSGRPADKPAPPEGGRAETGAAPKAIPNINVQNMAAAFSVSYLDWKLGRPFRLDLDISLKAHNLANFGLEDSLSGALSLQGNLLEKDRKCAFDLNGRVSPLADPLQASFDLSGSMQTCDLETFAGLIEGLGLKDGYVSGTATLVCRSGQFDPKSALRLKFSDVVLTREKADKMRGIPLPKSFTVVVPITGSLADPQVDVEAAFIRTMASEDMVESIIKGLLNQDGRPNGKSPDKQPQQNPEKTSNVKNVFDTLLGNKGQ